MTDYTKKSFNVKNNNKKFIIIDLNHPDLLDRSLAYNIVKKIPCVDLSDLRFFDKTPISKLVLIANKIIYGKKSK